MRRIQHIIWLLLVFVASMGSAWAQADYPWLRVGDELYERRSYTDAETAYRKALEEKEKPTTSFNLGNTIYNQNRLPEAIQQYQKS
ncbi:MAG TPA: tetratricopeptide repeat protein, partial [Saprospiraceae bacterium]|nr:tetratricopeptide repeat protein [Saprospiraceae bacterium]